MKTDPPKLPLKFLRWFCREEYLEEFEGDLIEMFEELYEISPTKARQKFIWDIIRHFRPGFIKSHLTQLHLNSKDMFRHHLLLAYRNFRRYKSSFIINLLGLSTGIAAALLIYLWVYNEVSIDQFHENKDRLYQVMRNTSSQPGELVSRESNSDLLAPALREEMPEVEHVVPVNFEDCSGILTVEQANIQAKGAVAGEDFFKVFSFPLIQGDRNHVLRGTNNIVISDQLAVLFFGSVEVAMNKSILFDQEDYEGLYHVSGVFGTTGYRSSEQFDFLIPYDVFLARRDPEYIHWGSNSSQVYLSLEKGTELADFNGKIKGFVRERFQIQNEPAGADWVGQLFLRPYSEKYLYSHYENGVKAGGRIDYIRLFSIIAVLILVIACINFMNLSTAQASRKLKQIGIKKVIGANRKTLIYQYIGEAMILTLLASCFAVGLVYLLIPSFNALTDQTLSLTLDGNFISGLLVITGFTGLLSGSYPAFYLSGFKPKEMLTGKLTASMGEFWTRKGLVGFQFCISILLMVSVAVIYQQMNFIQSENLGYKKDNVIVFDRQHKLYDNLEAFLGEINNLPGVESSSVIEDEVTDISSRTGVYMIQGSNTGEVKPKLYEAVVGYDFIETLAIEMSEGRAFSRQFSNEATKILLNEMAVERLGLTQPIGTIISWKGEEKEVIGVTKNFHGQSLYEEIKPMAILHEPEETNKMLVRIQAGTEQATISKLQAVYNTYYPGLPFEFEFLDDEYSALYVSEQRISTLFRYFAGIAIIISCLGLFGLANFSAERRLKEIGIRKILGASHFGIVLLLSKGFLSIILIANLITLPASYLLAKEWLNNFAYSIDLTSWYFIGAGLSALLIAWLTVGFQTFKAAYLNPIHCLRDE